MSRSVEIEGGMTVHVTRDDKTRSFCVDAGEMLAAILEAVE